MLTTWKLPLYKKHPQLLHKRTQMHRPLWINKSLTMPCKAPHTGGQRIILATVVRQIIIYITPYHTAVCLDMYTWWSSLPHTCSIYALKSHAYHSIKQNITFKKVMHASYWSCLIGGMKPWHSITNFDPRCPFHVWIPDNLWCDLNRPPTLTPSGLL